MCLQLVLVVLFCGGSCDIYIQYLMNMTHYEELKELDTRATRLIHHPQPQDGDRIFSELNHFMLMMNVFAEQLDEMSFKSIDCAVALYRYGKPVFLRKPIDESKVFNTHKWTQSSEKMFRFQVETCFKEWMNFKNSYIEYKLLEKTKNISVTQ